MAYRCHSQKRKHSWPIVAIDQNAFRCIYWSQRQTCLPEIKNGTNLKTKWKNCAKGKRDSGKSAKDLETIVVQHLSVEVSGKAQKYSQVGAREFVSFKEFNELSISNIKKACMKQYGLSETMSCDVLAGEQGPSCSSVKQLPNLKVIHMRFIECNKERVEKKICRG